MGPYYKTRAYCIQFFYFLEFQNHQDKANIGPANYLASFQTLMTSPPKFNPKQEIFLNELIHGTFNHLGLCKEKLVPKLKNWKWENLSVIDRIILLLATYELLYRKENNVETPKAPIINEYVELSKIYSTKKSSSFINGILDAL